MNVELKFVSTNNLIKFIEKLSGEIFLPKKNEKYFTWSKYPCDFTLEGYRSLFSPKFFFYSPQEVLVEKELTKRTIIGIKACDLRGILFLKKFFTSGDFIDPFFRTDVLLFSSDCTYISENCFCHLLGFEPYAKEGFDLNFTQLSDGYVVEVGSDRGNELIKQNSDIFEPASDKHIKSRDNLREKVVSSMPIGKKLNIQTLKFDKVYDKISKCVSCASCTNNCPACFCFILYDKINFEKIRFWDSCQYKGYARVAGGLNPRKELNSRFIHRLRCKFEYSVERFGTISCFGCGRCISGCLGGINFIEVIEKLS